MITPQTAAHIVRQHYGFQCQAKALPGEYDYNFLIESEAGHRYLLKIANPDSEAAVLQWQNTILHHLTAAALPFTVPVPQAAVNGSDVSQYQDYQVRLFSYVSGDLLGDLPDQSPALLANVGRQIGYLSRQLQAVQHPAARRKLKWDLQQSDWVLQSVGRITQPADKAIVDYFTQRFQGHALASLPALRQSIIHGDLNDYNILIDAAASQISGIIDFGDMLQTATVCELAIALAYLMFNKPDPMQAAATVIKHYHAAFPLQEAEIALLYDLIAMRLCISVITSAERKQQAPDNVYLTISEQPAWALLRQLQAMNPAAVENCFRHACGMQPKPYSTAVIQAVRARHLSPNLGLSYQAPLHIVRGEAQYLYDTDGKRYLDCVNNISHVGHCHPRVVAAGQRQMALLNTNTRYLHENIVRYAEALLRTVPAPLEVCYFVSSGSEANELALRLAAAYTGRDQWVVLDHGYYGNTRALVNLSPYKFNGRGGQGKPNNVHIIPLQLQQSIHDLIPPDVAAFMGEAIPGCGGQIILPDHYLQSIYAAVRKAGGVVIADEIQTGLGRIGEYFWAFSSHQVVPDILTLGKPLGNGHPLGAVITTRAIADAFCNGMEFFSSFGGNPVSMAIGLEVLDVITDENLQQHALQVGAYLLKELRALQERHALIQDVRGKGLFIGVEVSQHAERIVNQLCERGILLSADGPKHNVIKIKPPLVFTHENAAYLAENLDAAMAAL